MRSAFAALVIAASIAGASAQQIPRADPGKDSQNRTGRTAIPEKMGKPLERGLLGSDVKLRTEKRPRLPSMPYPGSRPQPAQK
jgi:hypothetical protein